MSRRRNVLFRLLLAALIVSMLLMCACHGSRGLDEFAVPESFDASRTYEISFWAKNDTNKVQTAIYEKAIADFEALYPNIHVNIRLYTDYARIYNDVITNIATKTTPNVCITYPDHIATYLTGANTVAPLDALFSDARYGLGGSDLLYDSPTSDEIIPQFLNECRFSGSYYAIPFMRSTEACYVNKTYVEALGYTLPEVLTWDFVWEVSDAAAKKNADGTYALNSQKVMLPFIYKSTDNMMIQMLAQKDAGYSTDSGDVLIFNDTTEQLIKTAAEHTKTGAFSTFKISGYPANFLNAGQCVFAVDSTAGSTWMGSKAPLSDISPDKLVDFETAVMTVPQFDPGNPKMISQGPSVCVFNKDDPQEVLASWLFAQYLLTDSVQIAYAQTEGYVPVTQKARDTDEYREYMSSEGTDDSLHYDVKLKASRLLLENTQHTFVTPVFNGSASLRDAAGYLIESAVKSTRRSQAVDDAYIDGLFSDVRSLYRLDRIGSVSSAKTDIANTPLPSASEALLVALICAWVLIGAYALYTLYKNRRNKTR